MLSRRAVLATPLVALAQPRPRMIETHIHLFSADTKSFPYAENAPYKPKADPVEDYVAFAVKSGIEHAVIVHPEPYQDDHRYLDYCFAHEPKKDYFKATMLLDPQREDTPQRMDALMKKHPGRFRALRVHRMSGPPTTSGLIKDRDLASPGMRKTWQAAQDRGLMIQMHFHPNFAKEVFAIAKQFPKVPVLIDHLGRYGQGTVRQFNDLLALAKLPNTVMKFSGVSYSSQEPWPHTDTMQQVRNLFDAFGAERMVAGTMGMDAEEFDKAVKLFDQFFAFTSAANREKLLAGNARKLFGWGKA